MRSEPRGVSRQGRPVGMVGFDLPVITKGWKGYGRAVTRGIRRGFARSCLCDVRSAGGITQRAIEVLAIRAGRQNQQQNGPGVTLRPVLSPRFPPELATTFCWRAGRGGTRAPVSAGVRRTLVCLSSLSGCAACVFFAVCSANTARLRRLTSISTTNCELSFSFGEDVLSSSSQFSGTCLR